MRTNHSYPMNTLARSGVLLMLSTLLASSSVAQIFLIDAKDAQYIDASAYAPMTNSVLFFSGSAMAAYDLSTSERVSLTWYDLGKIEPINAAISWSDSTMLIFSGSYYRTFDVLTGGVSAERLEWPGLPEEWGGSLDAAVRWSEEEVIFFKDDEYLVYDFVEEAYTERDRFTSWEGFPAGWTMPLETAFNVQGDIYLLNDGEAVLYSTTEDRFFLPSPIGIADTGAK
jgi:hypothetical protein